MNDSLIEIANFLQIHSIAKILRISKQTHMLNSNTLWQHICKRDFNIQNEQFECMQITDNYWYNIYQKNIFFNNDFYYGRCYQLVSDKSKKIFPDENEQYRNYYISRHMRNMKKWEVITEATIIANEAKCSGKNYNLYNLGLYVSMDDNNVCDSDENEYYDNKMQYFGRCVQFIMDQNKHTLINEFFGLTFTQVVERAHEIKYNVLKEYIEHEFEHKYNIKYCDCGTWYSGSNYCECGHNRIDFYIAEYITSLDDPEIEHYPEPYYGWSSGW